MSSLGQKLHFLLVQILGVTDFRFGSDSQVGQGTTTSEMRSIVLEVFEYGSLFTPKF